MVIDILILIDMQIFVVPDAMLSTVIGLLIWLAFYSYVSPAPTLKIPSTNDIYRKGRLGIKLAEKKKIA